MEEISKSGSAREGPCKWSPYSRKGSRLNTLDHIVDWTKPAKPVWMNQEAYEAYPPEVRLREVDISKEVSHVKKNRETFVIVTTRLRRQGISQIKARKILQKTLAGGGGHKRFEKHISYGAHQSPHSRNGGKSYLGTYSGLQCVAVAYAQRQ